MKKLRGLFLRASPEWVVTTALLAFAVALLVSLKAPTRWNDIKPLIAFVLSLATVYILVFFAVGFCRIIPPLMRHEENLGVMGRRFKWELSNGLCFALVVSLSFYLKLCVPLVRSKTYDGIYEAIDRVCFSWLNPLFVWRARELQFNWVDNLYLYLFLGMFVVSFLAHGMRGHSEFRRVFLASLLVQALGGCLYFAAPAIGPFLYHPSANGSAGAAEHYFYLVRQAEMAGGIPWLSANAGHYIVCGLAAMPSLHAAGSLVFLYYAWKYVRWLGWVYLPVFAWILFGAMATRWHYGIDLVAGIALACACIALADRWMRAHENAAQRAVDESIPRPQGEVTA